MSRKVVEIPVEVWEFSLQDAEHIAALHRETLRLMNENARLKAEVERLRHLEGVASSVDFYQQENEKLNEEIERLTMIKDACKRMIKRRDKWIFELKAEVERLKAELDQAECDYDNCQKRKVSIDNHRFDLFTENKTLKAEVERLRKAGDAMAETLEGAGFDSAMDFWNAAKEGKQP